MADKEGKFTSKYFIFCFLITVIICSVVEGNIRQLSFNPPKRVVEFNANDLPVFQEQKIENEHKLFKRDLSGDELCDNEERMFMNSLVDNKICQSVSK